jgi:hypothetical protein
MKDNVYRPPLRLLESDEGRDLHASLALQQKQEKALKLMLKQRQL